MRRAILLLLFALPLFAQLPAPLAQLPPGMMRVEINDERQSFTPHLLAATPDGTVWAFDSPDRVLRIASDGTVSRFQMPAIWRTSTAAPGPDGAIWVGSTGWIGRIDPVTNAVQRWPLGADGVGRILTGPDGNVWLVLSGSIWRMRPDGILLGTYDIAGRTRDGVFGSDGALYVAADEDRLVRLTVDGEQTEFPSPRLRILNAGPDFLWSWAGRAVGAPDEPTVFVELLKVSLRGELLRTYDLRMHAIGGDAEGNFWFRSSTPDGNREVLARLSPSGVLTQFGPLPATSWTDCHSRSYGGSAFLPDGRVAVSDYYLGPVTLISPCRAVPWPAEYTNTVTIFDPALAPVLSVETLDRTQRRRSSRK